MVTSGVDKSASKLFQCHHLNESYWAVLSYGTFFAARYKVVLAYVSVDKIVPCDYSKREKNIQIKKERKKERKVTS